jgi:hypothetical protein
MGKKSELEELVAEIKKETKQISINKVDEVRVMRTMLNDPDFSIGVYDKSSGYVGQRCPHEEAVKFVKNIISGSTGLDQKDSKHLAESYEFTKRDANFMLDNMRDFISVYMDTGRKINIMQSAATEACLFTKDVPSSKKSVPDKENPGKSKTIITSPYIKLVSSAKCPKYNEK